MLSPSDPQHWPELWSSLEEQLLSYDACIVVDQGRGNPVAPRQKLSPTVVSALITRMKATQISCIYGNRGVAIGPHCCGEKVDNGVVAIQELIVLPWNDSSFDTKQIAEDIEKLALGIFVLNKTVNRIRVPVELPKWDTSFPEYLEHCFRSGEIEFKRP